MITKPFLAVFVSLLILVTASGVAAAQSGREAEGRAAEQAGKLREALAHYVAALQSVSEGSADDQRLRETIITLVQKLSPAPAIPEEARRFSVRAQIAIKEAKSTADFDEAAREFGKALRVAPWWPDGYFNQGVAWEKAGKYTEAIRSLKFYLLAAPGAADAEKIKEQIYALEYRQEKAQKETATKRQEQEAKARVEAEKKAQASSLAGYWRDVVGSRYLFKVDGNSFTVTRVMGCWRPPSQEWGTCPDLRPDNTPFLFGTVNNDSLSGYGVNLHNHRTRRVINPDGTSLACPVAAGNYPIIRSEISADGTRLKIAWADTPNNPNCPPMEFGGEYRREQ
jgi:hypothetical protein